MRRRPSSAAPRRRPLGAALVVSLVGLACDLGQDRYDVRLDNAAGLIRGDEVRIAGVRVGKVVGLELADAGVVVAIAVDPGTPIYADARAYAEPKSTFGEKYLKIVPGEASAERLAPGATIERYEGALEMSMVLNQLRPLIDDRSPSSFPKIARAVQMWNGLLSLTFGDPEVDAPPDTAALDAANRSTDSWRSAVNAWAGPIRTQLDAAERRIVRVVVERIVDRVDARLATLERDLPGDLDALDARLARFEAELDAYDPDAVGRLNSRLDRVAVVVADLRVTTAAFEGFDRELLQLLRDLVTITTGLRTLDGAAIRQFLQIEGTRSHWEWTPQEVRRRLDDLGVDAPEDE
ncbi:MAG: MCE family protein [Myxococcales bacterium]|nr:MCE family protein [Myxococcales bacterium]